MSHPLTSPEAASLLSVEPEDRIRYLRAKQGGCFDASSEGWDDGHYLWGPVDVIGDPDPLFRLESRNGRLEVAPANDVPELVPWETPKDGVYITFEGGSVTSIGWAETDTASVLYVTFLINPPTVFSAKGAAIAVTQFHPETETKDLKALALEAAA